MTCCFDGNKIKELLIEEDISQDFLAKKIGITQAVISRMSRGVTKDPSLFIICKIAKYFDKNIEYFLK